MISENFPKRYCSEPIESIENYEQAVNDTNQMWHCHHRLEIQGQFRNSRELLKRCGMYWSRPASELIFLRHDEHCRLHREGNNPWRGRHHTQKSKALMSSQRKGHEVTQETREKMSKSQKRRMVKMTSIGDGTERVFDSIHDAERWLMDNGFPKAAVVSIWSCLNGKRTRAYNARWMYAGGEDD